MSGGAFGHQQYRINDIASQIREVIDGNADQENGRGYSKKTLQRLKAAVAALERAAIYAHRVDWLLSDDHGEETFLRRLAEDLAKLKQKR